MQPLTPEQMRHGEAIMARAVQNLVRLERRVYAELMHARQRPGNAAIVGDLENDFQQLRRENELLGALFDRDSTLLITLDAALAGAAAANLDQVRVTIESEAQRFDVFYSLEREALQ